MIVYFSVKNFRSIRDKITLDFRATSISELAEYYIQEFPELNLKLLKMAMLFGKNASGKTNVLRALDFLRSFIVLKDTNKNKPTGIQPFALDEDKNSEYDLKFVHENIIYQYKITMNRSYIVSEHLYHWPHGSKARIFTRELKKNSEHIEYAYNWFGIKASSRLKGNLELTVANQSVLTNLQSYQYSGPMQQAYDWFRNSLVNIVTPESSLTSWNRRNFLNDKKIEKYKDFYISQLQIADFIVSDITVNEEEVDISEIPDDELFKQLIEKLKEEDGSPKKVKKIDVLLSHHVSDGDFTLDLEEQSEGTIRFLGLCGFLCWIKETNRIIPIDEIERSMHEDLIKHFLASYLTYAQKSQLIFTSHNSSILNMKDIIRRDTIWITDRLENGGTDLTRITNYPIKKEHSVGNLFRKGLIGGKPDIGSVLLDKNDEK